MIWSTSAKYPAALVNPKWVDQAIDYCLDCVRNSLAQLEGFPERTQDGEWVYADDGGWVGGHWIGLLWLSYAHSQDPALQTAARTWAARLAPRQSDTTTHDLGFLFELSHVLGYELTGDEVLKATALQAAETLSLRFNHHGGFFQAWGPMDAPPELRGRAIIDTMMNLDLLFWASRQTGDPRYAQMAKTHARTVMKYQIRPDFSTAHVIDFDPESGEFIQRDTHQGFSSTSCWSRGQSWAVYGFCDCYRETGDPVFLEIARGLAQYALTNLPSDRVPYWDYRSPEILQDVRDSSAASILSAALLSLANLEPNPEETARWRTQAKAILNSLWESYSSRGTSSPSILIHGTRSKPHDLIDHGLIYGDYYFLEALLQFV